MSSSPAPAGRFSDSSEHTDVMGAELVSIALCLITYRRPRGLGQALQGVGGLEVDPSEVDLRLVVVDNDPSGSAEDVVKDFASRSVYPVAYAVEPQQGIPFARNRAVQLAGDVDFIGWLDDDEVPIAAWLSLLVAALRCSRADVVLGPSEPSLPAGAASWIAAGGFFDRTRFPSGTVIPAHYARTSGVLVRRAAMPARQTAFVEELRFTGGSDREHFVAMEKAGATFVWVDEAVVVEKVPESRACSGWILRRAFRIGNSRSITLVLQHPPMGKRVKRVGAGATKMVTGSFAALVGLPRGKGAAMQGLWKTCYGAGLAFGALGYRYDEYRKHHGG
ncbi:MAG: glycosyltransferase [Actinomycetia bacterium]|nr:glycosyltransferase [Actinomycetes bacterium]